jgi:hypothetical protein
MRMQDRVPMIVLTGCVDADEALSYTHQVLDHRRFCARSPRRPLRLTAEGAGWSPTRRWRRDRGALRAGA